MHVAVLKHSGMHACTHLQDDGGCVRSVQAGMHVHAWDGAAGGAQSGGRCYVYICHAMLYVSIYTYVHTYTQNMVTFLTY